MSRNGVWPWADLGLDGPTDLRGIKRAYAARLKTIDRNDPVAFQNLQAVFAAAKEQIGEEASAPLPGVAALIGEERVTRSSWPPPSRFERPRADTGSAPGTAASNPGPILHPPAGPKADLASEPGKQLPEPAMAETVRSRTQTVEDLDALHALDSQQAEGAWWAMFRTALSDPWDTDALNRLLSLDMARGGAALRVEAEQALFADLENRPELIRNGFHRSMAQFLEDHFSWRTDGVGLNRRFGRRRYFHLIMEAFSRSFLRARPLSRRAERLRLLAIYAAVLFGLSINVILKEPAPAYDPASLLFYFLAVGFSFFVLLACVFLFLAPLCRALGVLRGLKYLGMRLAPNLTQAMCREPQGPQMLYPLFTGALAFLFARLG